MSIWKNMTICREIDENFGRQIGENTTLEIKEHSEIDTHRKI